uniref:Uncharacterized protein n=1 Tax=Triticum urartu TaxID=4572 RepID=A0A8R7K2N4_TRIUA
MGAAGGGCWPGAPAPGRTRRGARPSAAAAARACPCTCPCRRACWSPRSTTRWRGAASAATASTCRDHRPPPHAARARRWPRSNVRRREEDAACSAGRPGRPPSVRDRIRAYCARAVQGRAPSVYMYVWQ